MAYSTQQQWQLSKEAAAGSAKSIMNDALCARNESGAVSGSAAISSEKASATNDYSVA